MLVLDLQPRNGGARDDQGGRQGLEHTRVDHRIK
jgi:hypothetical protein